MAFNVKDKKWLGYFIYVVLVTGFLLYVLFPAATVEEFINNSVRKVNPGLTFNAGRIGPWIPAGLRFFEPRIYAEGKSQSPIFRAESIFAGPKVLKLFQGEQQFQLDGRAYSGKMNGWLKLPGKNKELLAGEISFENFDLAAHEILAKEFKYRITGRAGGNITFKDNQGSDEDISGKAVLRLSQGQLKFQEAIFGIGSVDLQSVELELELNNRQVDLVKAALSGSEIKGSVSGSIQLQKDIMQSSLNLRGTLEPLAEFYKNNPGIRELLKNMKKRVKRGQYSFAITGTLGDPRFKLL